MMWVSDKSLDCLDLVWCGLYGADAQIPGQKTLVLDPSLAGPLGLVTEVAALKVCCTSL